MGNFPEEAVLLLKEMTALIKEEQQWRQSMRFALLAIASDPNIDQSKLLAKYDEILAAQQVKYPDALNELR